MSEMESIMEVIGDLHGVNVVVNHETRHVYLSHSYFPPIKFSIDHPFIQGSRLERDARAAMDGANSSGVREGKS
jgi:hypothetical protein